MIFNFYKKEKPGYDYSGHLPKPTTVTLLVTFNYSKLKDGADAVTRYRPASLRPSGVAIPII